MVDWLLLLYDIRLRPKSTQISAAAVLKDNVLL